MDGGRRQQGEVYSSIGARPPPSAALSALAAAPEEAETAILGNGSATLDDATVDGAAQEFGAMTQELQKLMLAEHEQSRSELQNQRRSLEGQLEKMRLRNLAQNAANSGARSKAATLQQSVRSAVALTGDLKSAVIDATGSLETVAGKLDNAVGALGKALAAVGADPGSIGPTVSAISSNGTERGSWHVDAAGKVGFFGKSLLQVDSTPVASKTTEMEVEPAAPISSVNESDFSPERFVGSISDHVSQLAAVRQRAQSELQARFLAARKARDAEYNDLLQEAVKLNETLDGLGRQSTQAQSDVQEYRTRRDRLGSKLNYVQDFAHGMAVAVRKVLKVVHATSLPDSSVQLAQPRAVEAEDAGRASVPATVATTPWRSTPRTTSRMRELMQRMLEPL